MSGFNMPPGATVAQIPGNTPEDELLYDLEQRLKRDACRYFSAEKLASTIIDHLAELGTFNECFDPNEPDRGYEDMFGKLSRKIERGL